MDFWFQPAAPLIDFSTAESTDFLALTKFEKRFKIWVPDRINEEAAVEDIRYATLREA